MEYIVPQDTITLYIYIDVLLYFQNNFQFTIKAGFLIWQLHSNKRYMLFVFWQRVVIFCEQFLINILAIDNVIYNIRSSNRHRLKNILFTFHGFLIFRFQHIALKRLTITTLCVFLCGRNNSHYESKIILHSWVNGKEL